MSGESQDRRRFPARGALIPILMVGVVGWLAPFPSTGEPSRKPSGNPAAEVRPDSIRPLDDARVRAFLETYGPLVDTVADLDDDVVFTLGGKPIYFRDGRMLREDRLGEADGFDPVFYRYPQETLRRAPASADLPHYSTDVFEALFGVTETQVRTQCESATFLGHRMFLNTLVLDPLRKVEEEITRAAAVDPAVARWIEELEITYSFIFREIAGSDTRSLHSFGLAVDLEPSSYRGRHAYWRWSRVLDRENWFRIPPSQRWSPPPPVIEAFERNGFVWGGKWSYFDVIHFEYRPEVLLYNRVLQNGTT